MLKDKKDQVEYILKKYPITRSDDDLLYLAVIGQFYGIDTKAISFSDLMRNRKRWGLPSTETIRRSRQKITEDNPELRGDRKTEQARYQKQVEYMELARA